MGAYPTLWQRVRNIFWSRARHAQYQMSLSQARVYVAHWAQSDILSDEDTQRVQKLRECLEGFPYGYSSVFFADALSSANREICALQKKYVLRRLNSR